MVKQYWVGNYYVDLSRNLIRKESEPQNLPPKALLVLTHLAENPGKVVSYEQLLDNVWPNSVVTPNTLQRSIAQLRKALSDDAQEIIKTHSKQGYSLETEVKWESLEATTSPAKKEASNSSITDAPKSSNTTPLIGLVVAAVITILVFALTNQDSSPTLVQGELRYVTATDDKEFDASWSPDGKLILFHRYPEKLCINNLWAKDAETRQEFQLTKQQGTYLHHSLSPNSKNLVYIKQENCEQPVVQNICYRLMNMDFQAALQEPQNGRELLSCENSSIKKPVWVDDEHIVLMQQDSQTWRLVRYSLSDASTSAFYQVENGTVQAYSWSADKQQFAVSAVKENGEFFIDMVSANGELLSSHPVKLAAESPKFMRLRPTFVPNSDELLFTDRKDLYTLSTDGKVQLQNFNFDENVGGPVFHPDGKRLLLVKGRYDSDIASVSIDGMAPDSETRFEVLQRSNVHEDNTKFQPGGDHIAFISARTGNEQLWIAKPESQPKMLSKLPEGSYVGNIQWNPPGTGVMVLANSELYQVSLEGEQHKYESDYPVLDLFHWDDTSQKVIGNIKVDGLMKFVEIDLSTMEYQPINNKLVNWAVKTPDSPLIFIDHLNRFWQKTELEDKLIPELNNQTKRKARFVMHQHTIYSINKQEQLWSYNLQTKEFNVLGNPPPHSDYLTDASADKLLFTFVVAAKKEIVELEVGQ